MTQEMTAPGAELYCPTCELHFPVGELCPDDGTRLVRLGAPVDPFVGRELDGRYTILEKLGQGGMGAVYRARQHSMGREVAVKVVNQSVVADAQSIKRFLREAKLVSRLTHPNIVAVLDFAQAPDGLFYLVMELVEGRTLQQAIVTEGRFALPRILRIAAQICDALEGAHRMPIAHRDLKPANIMLLAAGRDLVKVLDFGLAKSLSVDNASTTMTSAGALLGTPTFMPPEVANGEPFVDGRADLYSLGCILFMLGTGRPPFVSDSIPEMIAMHGSTPAPPMTGVPGPFARVVDRLLRKDPNERYQTAAATREALEAAFDETRMRGLDPDTLDDELAPTLVPMAAETLDSGPPERPSEARTTNVFASAISNAPIPVTPLSFPPPAPSSSSSSSSLPLPPPPLSVERSPVPVVTHDMDAPIRLRSFPIGIVLAFVVVIVSIVIAVIASRSGSDAPAVAPASSPPDAPVETAPPPGTASGTASSATVEVPQQPVAPPIQVKPGRPDKPRVRPTVRKPGAGSGSARGSAVDPGASPF